ncbi:MAG: hypothetical protein ACLQVD_12840 [Capsulimonadaceae bacterium]
MKDGNVYLISNATVTASYNGSSYDFLTTPGSPIRGYEFAAYVTGSVVNGGTSTAGVATFVFEDSPDTSFTFGPTYTEFQTYTFTSGTATSNTLTPPAFPLPIKMQNRYGRMTVVPPANVTISGLSVQLASGRTV